MGNEVLIRVREEGTAQTQQALKGLGAAVTGTALGFGAFQIARDVMNRLTGSVTAALDAARDLNRVQAQTAAVLQSTGGAAGMSAQAVRSLAESLEAVTGIDEIAVQGAENLLLTFTRIGSDIFPQVTAAVADMATAMNQGATPSAEQLASTAIQVGKAMQDPILGLTALRRVGVNFSDAQKDVIKALVDGGRAGEAQALILKELQKEFGGSAAAASAARGGIDQSRDAMEDAARAMAEKLLPVLIRVQKMMFDTGAAVLQNKPILIGLAATFGVILVLAIGAFVAALSPVTLIVLGVAAAIGALAAAAAFLVEHWDRVRDAIRGRLRPVLDALGAVFARISDFVQEHAAVLRGLVLVIVGALALAFWPLTLAIGAVILAFKHWDQITSVVGAVLGAVGNVIGQFIDWLGNAWSGITDALTAPFQAMIEPVKGAMQKVAELVGKALEWIGERLAKLGNIEVFGIRPFEALGQLGSMLSGAVGDIFGNIGDLIGTGLGKVGGALGSLTIPFPELAAPTIGAIAGAAEDMAAGTKEKMTEWQQEMNRILDGFTVKQVEAYLKGGDAAVAVVQEQQQRALDALVAQAVEFHQHLGIDLPDALRLAAEAADEAAKAQLEMAKAAEAAQQKVFDLTMQLWRSAGGPGTSSAGFQNLAALAFAAEHGGAGVGGGTTRTVNPDGSVTFSNSAAPTTNVTINAGVIGDPVATGKMVADAVNAAGQALGPVISGAAVGE
jgi:hypothetical protein